MLAVRLGRKENAGSAVPFGVHYLDECARITSVSSAVEDGAGIIFLRLVIEDQDNFAVRVERGVGVISEFRRGDTVTGEGTRRPNLGFKRAATEELDIVP